MILYGGADVIGVREPLATSTPDRNLPVLEMVGLRVAFPYHGGELTVIDDVSLAVNQGECVGLVGELGSGKTMTALAAMRLVPAPGRITGGQVLYAGRDLLKMPEGEVRGMRGVGAGLVSQNPMSALNPVLRVGFQIQEAMEVHRRYPRPLARPRVPLLMSQAGIPDAARRQRDYPHQFSGGMRQRVCIAMATSNEPALIIADEPTTALDVTIRAQILLELQRLRETNGCAVLVITHDIEVIEAICDRVIVMYAGRVVEAGATQDVLSAPEHPYTWSLLRSVPRVRDGRQDRLTSIQGTPPSMAALPPGCTFEPRCPFAIPKCSLERPTLSSVNDTRSARCFVLVSNVPSALQTRPAVPSIRGNAHAAPALDEPAPLIRASRVSKVFRRGFKASMGLTAVANVSLEIYPGEVMGLVGESGSGKSTLGRMLLSLDRPTEGEVLIDGVDLANLSSRRRRRVQARTHMVFQDPYSALDPRMRVADLIAEPLSRAERRDFATRLERVADVMTACGLGREDGDRFPHEFSGGQLQRISIARALIGNPRFIVADEPVASLDVSIQAQIINLLQELQDSRALTYLFISHDLAVVRHIADRIAVMYLGKVVELGTNDEIFEASLHPYTMMLLAAGQAKGGSELSAPAGEIPSPLSPPSGCRFHTRCPWARPSVCSVSEPEVREYKPGHWAACHFAELLEQPVGALLEREDAVGSDGLDG